MEFLAKEIRQISLSSLSAGKDDIFDILAPSEIDDDLDGIVNARIKVISDPDEWKVSIYRILRQWWGFLFKSNYERYVDVLRRHFRPDPDLDRILNDEIPQISERCRRIQISITEVEVYNKSWWNGRYYIEFVDPYESKLCRLSTSEISGYEFRIYPESNPVLEFRLWKDGNGTSSDEYKGSCRFNFDPSIHFTESESSKVEFFKYENRETGSLKLGYRIYHPNGSNISVEIPKLIFDYFRQLVFDETETFINNNNNNSNYPIYKLSASETRIGEIYDGDIETRLYYNNELVFTFNSNSIRYFDTEIRDIFNDFITIRIYSISKRHPIHEFESKRISEFIFPSINNNNNGEWSRHINKTTFLWKFEIRLPTFIDSITDITSVMETLFYRFYRDDLLTKLCYDEVDDDDDIYGDILLDWDGKLSPGYSNFISAIEIFDPERNGWNRQRGSALLRLHLKYHFDNRVLTDYLSLSTESTESTKKAYVNYAIHHLAYYAVDGNYTILPLSQLRTLLHNLFVITDSSKDRVLDRLRSEMELRIRSYYGNGDALLSDHKSILEQSIVPSLKTISSRFCINNDDNDDDDSDFGSKWSNILATTYLDVSIPILQDLIENDLNCDRTNGFTTYNIYIRLRMVTEYSSRYQNTILVMFRKCLDSWIDCSLFEATKQIERVLDMERKRISHNNNDNDNDGFNDVMESASTINGIFDTCRFVWEEIKWPFPLENIRFGTKLLRGLHSLYSRYIRDFHTILIQDGWLSVEEFVDLLNAAHHSVTYLRDFQHSINTLIDELSLKMNDFESERHELTEQIVKFTDILAEAQQETDSWTEELITRFCHDQSPIICRYIYEKRQIHDEDPYDANGDESSLQYVNTALKAVYEGIDTGDSYVDTKLMTLIKESLIKVHDDQVFKYYETLKARYEGSSKWTACRRQQCDPNIFSELTQALPYIIGFRRTLSLADNPEIMSLQRELYPRAVSSPLLASIHMKSLYNNPKITTSEPVGTVSISLAPYLKGIIIDLRSITNVIPRKGKKETNFSISVAILPNPLKTNSGSRYRTEIYPNSTNILFDMVYDNGTNTEYPKPHEVKHCFRFELVENDPSIERFLSVELFDHSRTLPQKYFRGWSIIPLTQITSSSNQQLDLYPVVLSDDSVEFNELLKRKDNVAKDYVYRLQKYALEKPMHFNPMTMRQEWIKLNR